MVKRPDLVFPGTNNMGLNKKTKWPKRGKVWFYKADKASFWHDQAYRRYKKGNPYINWIDGDYVFERGIANSYDPASLAGKAFVNLKKLTKRKRSVSKTPFRNKTKINPFENHNLNMDVDLPSNYGNKKIKRSRNGSTIDKGNSYIVNPKKRKASKKKKFKLPKKVVKSIKRLKQPPLLLGVWDQNKFLSCSSDINKVAWNIIFEPTNASCLGFLQSEQMMETVDGTTTVLTRDPVDLNTGYGGNGQRYKIIWEFFYWIRNNTNAPALLDAYMFKATTDCSSTVTGDLDARISADYYTKNTTSNGAASAPLAKEDDMGRFWSTRQKSTMYAIQTKKKMRVAPGDEVKFSFKTTQFIDLANPFSETYYKTSPHIIFRQMGVPTHDDSAVTTTGLSQTLLDVYERRRVNSYKLESDSSIANRYITIANTIGSITTAVIAGESTILGFEDQKADN